MSNRRLLLIVGAISVLGGIGVAAAILHVAPHAVPTILRWDEDGERDGTAFGRDVDTTGCVAEAIRRVGGTLNFKRRFIAGRFLKACLEVAERDPELCDGVPAMRPRAPPTARTRLRCRGASRCADASRRARRASASRS